MRTAAEPPEGPCARRPAGRGRCADTGVACTAPEVGCRPAGRNGLIAPGDRSESVGPAAAVMNPPAETGAGGPARRPSVRMVSFGSRRRRRRRKLCAELAPPHNNDVAEPARLQNHVGTVMCTRSRGHRHVHTVVEDGVREHGPQAAARRRRRRIAARSLFSHRIVGDDQILVPAAPALLRRPFSVRLSGTPGLGPPPGADSRLG